MKVDLVSFILLLKFMLFDFNFLAIDTYIYRCICKVYDSKIFSKFITVRKNNLASNFWEDNFITVLLISWQKIIHFYKKAEGTQLNGNYSV